VRRPPAAISTTPVSPATATGLRLTAPLSLPS
jgi:hypothetical protein